MKSPTLRTIAETTGIIAIVLSLVFLGQEIRQNREIASSELRSAVFGNGAELNALLMEHADIWVRGNAGDKLDAVDSEIYFRLIQSYNDFYYNLVQQSELLGLGWEKADMAMLVGFLHDNPGAYRVWREREVVLTRWRSTLGAYDRVEDVEVNEWVEAIDEGIRALAAARQDRGEEQGL